MPETSRQDVSNASRLDSEESHRSGATTAGDVPLLAVTPSWRTACGRLGSNRSGLFHSKSWLSVAFPKDFKELIGLFNKNSVEYLIVGGYAFGVHVEPRATKNLDLFIRSNLRNSEAVWNSLARLGATLASYSPEDFRDGESTIQIGNEPNRIDIIQKIDGVTFDEAWKDRVLGEIDGELPVSLISRERLLQNKRAAARPRDLADAHEIEEAGKEIRATP